MASLGDTCHTHHLVRFIHSTHKHKDSVSCAHRQSVVVTTEVPKHTALA